MKFITPVTIPLTSTSSLIDVSAYVSDSTITGAVLRFRNYSPNTITVKFYAPGTTPAIDSAWVFPFEQIYYITALSSDKMFMAAVSPITGVKLELIGVTDSDFIFLPNPVMKTSNIFNITILPLSLEFPHNKLLGAIYTFRSQRTFMAATPAYSYTFPTNILPPNLDTTPYLFCHYGAGMGLSQGLVSIYENNMVKYYPDIYSADSSHFTSAGGSCQSFINAGIIQGYTPLNITIPRSTSHSDWTEYQLPAGATGAAIRLNNDSYKNFYAGVRMKGSSDSELFNVSYTANHIVPCNGERKIEFKILDPSLGYSLHVEGYFTANTLTSNDIRFYYSGGATNTVASKSLGGLKSACEVPASSMNTIFDNVSSSEASSGRIEYRAIYVTNVNPYITLSSAVLWIDTNTPAADNIEIAIADSNGTSTVSVANETVSPSGFSFTSPSSKAAGLSIGSLPPNSSRCIWIKRVVSPQTSSYASNYFSLRVEGTY